MSLSLSFTWACELTGLFGMVVLPLQSGLLVSAVKPIINLIAITVAYLDCP